MKPWWSQSRPGRCFTSNPIWYHCCYYCSDMFDVTCKLMPHISLVHSFATCNKSRRTMNVRTRDPLWVFHHLKCIHLWDIWTMWCICGLYIARLWLLILLFTSRSGVPDWTDIVLFLINLWLHLKILSETGNVCFAPNYNWRCLSSFASPSPWKGHRVSVHVWGVGGWGVIIYGMRLQGWS